MIARKIERVSDDERKSLLAAAVQGQEFDAEPVSAALGVDPLTLEEQLESLQSAHGLVQRGEEVEYPDGTLTLRNRFVHVLYQNVLYGDASPGAPRPSLRPNRAGSRRALRQRRRAGGRPSRHSVRDGARFHVGGEVLPHGGPARDLALGVPRGA